MSNNSPLKGFFYLLKTGIVAQALTFASVFLVMYKYDPGSFGVFTIIISFATLISAISALRIERALVVEADSRIPGLLKSCIILTLISACICFLILGIVLLFQEKADSVFSLAACLGGLYCFLTGIGQVFSHIAIRDQRLQLIGISELLFAALLVCLIWIVEPGADGSMTLLGIYTAARVGSLLSYGVLDLAKWGKNVRENTPFRELAKYISSVFTTVLSNIQFRGIYYLSGLYFGSAATGNIALAHRVMFSPINLIGTALRRAYFREFAHAEDDTRIKSHVAKVLIYGSILSALLFPVVSYLVEGYAHLAVPEKWAALPGYLLILYPAASILVLLSWLDRVYDAKGKQHLALRYEAFYTAVLYLVLAGLVTYTDVTIFLTTYTFVTVAYNIIWAFITLRMLNARQEAGVILGATHLFICTQVIM